jgi:PhzF family phenazine biosynthesis protein
VFSREEKGEYMKRYPYYEVSAFTTEGGMGPFSGNPAGVVLLDQALPVEMMQRVAEQNNLAETAFLVPEGEGYRIRWFTPTSEIDLCGHATLGSAFALMQHGFIFSKERPLTFYYAAGVLRVVPEGELLSMDFPLVRGEKLGNTAEFERILGVKIEEAHLGRDLALILPTENDVRAFNTHNPGLAHLPGLGCIVTARSATYDFVSRAFFPELGIAEDPVTGSAHCFLAGIWSDKLSKRSFNAYQASPRGGDLGIEIHGDRVVLKGRACQYLRGEIVVPS